MRCRARDGSRGGRRERSALMWEEVEYYGERLWDLALREVANLDAPEWLALSFAALAVGVLLLQGWGRP